MSYNSFKNGGLTELRRYLSWLVLPLICLSVCAHAAADSVRLIPLAMESMNPSPFRSDSLSAATAETIALAQRLRQHSRRVRRQQRVLGLSGSAISTMLTNLMPGAPAKAPLQQRPHKAFPSTLVVLPKSNRSGTLPTGRDLEVRLRGIGTPRSMQAALQADGTRPALQRPDPSVFAVGRDEHERTARLFLRHYRDYLRVDSPDQEFSPYRTEVDALGRRHVRFVQRFGELQVWPADLVVHLDGSGQAKGLTGAFIPTPQKLVMRPVVAADHARKIALESVLGEQEAETSEPKLIVYAPQDRVARLAWKMSISRSPAERWVLVIDAINGKELNRFNDAQSLAATGSGLDLFGDHQTLRVWQENDKNYLVDTSKPMFDASSNPPQPNTTRGAIIIQDANNTPKTADPQTFPKTFPVTSSELNGGWLADAVSAATNLAITYDYYKQIHQRDSIDAQNGTILGVIRTGLNMQNAFWVSELNSMFFGDADKYAGALDVVAHEMTHGVTAHSANLIYQNQPGALNEAMSDIFGEMVEAYATGANNWNMGTPGLSFAIRDFVAPFPASMSEYIKTFEDNGGVHSNSSIINHAFYLLAERSVGGIGTPDAEKIFYRALTVYLTQNSQFLDARIAALQSAEDLFGVDSPQWKRTSAAFDAVEIFDGKQTPPPSGPRPAIRRADATLFMYFDPSKGMSLLGRRETASDRDLGIPLGHFAAAQARPAVTADGRVAMYVTEDHDICFIKTRKNARESCLNLPHRFYSVGMAPDGEHYAVVWLDSNGGPRDTISVLDINEPEKSKEFTLISPATEGVSIKSVVQADVMAFTANGRYLIYDAFNLLNTDDGAGNVVEVGAWSLYAIDLSTEQTLILVPPVPGKDIGNPAIGNLSDDLITYEVMDQVSSSSTVYTGNLSTGATSSSEQPIATVINGLAMPVFSGDDRAVVYSVPDSDPASPTGSSLLRQALLSDDPLSKDGLPELWLKDAINGVIYSRGARFKLNARITGSGVGQVASNPAGIDCDASCSMLFRKNTRIKLTATAASGSTFAGWKGACKGKKKCSLTVDKKRSVTAVFKRLPAKG